jgi:hypothetical protein
MGFEGRKTTAILKRIAPLSVNQKVGVAGIILHSLISFLLSSNNFLVYTKIKTII